MTIETGISHLLSFAPFAVTDFAWQPTDGHGPTEFRLRLRSGTKSHVPGALCDLDITALLGGAPAGSAPVSSWIDFATRRPVDGQMIELGRDHPDGVRATPGHRMWRAQFTASPGDRWRPSAEPAPEPDTIQIGGPAIASAICAALGIDPAHCTGLVITVTPGIVSAGMAGSVGNEQARALTEVLTHYKLREKPEDPA